MTVHWFAILYAGFDDDAGLNLVWLYEIGITIA